MAKTALEAFGTTVFSEMTALATAHGAVNLGQGFPDFEGPSAIVDAAVAALRAGHNQYGRSAGVLPLVEAVAAQFHRRTGVAVDPLAGVVCTAGATEALAAAMIGLLDPGDEVLLLEPVYDGYPATLAMAGAVPKVATLRHPDFGLPLEELRALIGPRTRMLVLNTPHNPTGKVFAFAELAALAELCVAHDLIVVADEVYEHLTFGVPHLSIAALPGMAERTVTISSTGKTFSFTGWKVGWALGPAPLIAAVQRAHQFLTFCAATPLHMAMAEAVRGLGEDFVDTLQREYRARRDFLAAVLADVGFGVALPDGAYFILADIRGLSDEGDVAFARRLVTEAGVATIPPSGFYLRDRAAGTGLLRFAFCKRRETLEAAAGRLRQWRAARR